MSLYIGLMSGSSVNAIDAALCDFAQNKIQLIATHTVDIPPSIKASVRGLIEPGYNEIHRLCALDRKMAKLFARGVLELLTKAQISATEITAIGSHGQTIRHSPQGDYGYTLQIGDPNTIAAETGITTIADFRRRDIAYGGQGAPLACGFHEFLLRDNKENRVILNIGGIANITLLPKDKNKNIIGFDTGTGNTLIDYVMRTHFNHEYDDEGKIARSGKIDEKLLNVFLSDPFLEHKPPKSTSTDYFSINWLENKLSAKIDPINLLTTLTEFTARTISDAIEKNFSEADSIWLCGGGAYNKFLFERLQQLNPKRKLTTTQETGIAPEWIEAAAFAWLAKQTFDKKPANCPSVTGASQETLLGGVYN